MSWANPRSLLVRLRKELEDPEKVGTPKDSAAGSSSGVPKTPHKPKTKTKRKKFVSEPLSPDLPSCGAGSAPCSPPPTYPATLGVL